MSLIDINDKVFKFQNLLKVKYIEFLPKKKKSKNLFYINITCDLKKKK